MKENKLTLELNLNGYACAVVFIIMYFGMFWILFK